MEGPLCTSWSGRGVSPHQAVHSHSPVHPQTKEPDSSDSRARGRLWPCPSASSTPAPSPLFPGISVSMVTTSSWPRRFCSPARADLSGQKRGSPEAPRSFFPPPLWGLLQKASFRPEPVRPCEPGTWNPRTASLRPGASARSCPGTARPERAALEPPPKGGRADQAPSPPSPPPRARTRARGPRACPRRSLLRRALYQAGRRLTPRGPPPGPGEKSGT